MKFGLTDHLWILFCVIALAVGQVLFKFVASQMESIASAVRDVRLLSLTAAALCLYALSTAAWILVLRRVPLSYAYVFMALGFVLVPLAGHLLFKEAISLRYLVGVALVALGLWLAVSSASPSS